MWKNLWNLNYVLCIQINERLQWVEDTNIFNCFLQNNVVLFALAYLINTPDIDCMSIDIIKSKM